MFKWKRGAKRRVAREARTKILSFAIDPLEKRRLLAGVTLITHGFGGAGSANPASGNTAEGWMYAMAQSIADQPGIYAAIYKITASDNGSGGGPITISSPVPLAGDVPNTSPNPEIILLLDWSALAGSFGSSLSSLITGTSDVRSTVDVAQAVANALLTPSFVPAIPELAALPIDLIGHSRGGSLVAQLAEDLGERGVWVDQVTTLDPHPVNGVNFPSFEDFGDSTPQHWSNIVFFDNYWQDGDGTVLTLSTIAGEDVAGAFNEQLDDAVLDTAGYSNFPYVVNSGEHSDVHLWYQGTVNPSAGIPNDGSASGGSDWYETSNGMGPQADTGYYFSQVVGGNRAEYAPEGLSVAFGLGGSASTVPITTSGTQYPDIGYVQLINSTSNNVQIGTSLNVTYDIQTSDTDATLRWYLDTDQNPLNNSNPIELQMSPTPANTASMVKETSIRSISTTNAPAGDYYVYAEIDDGGLIRYAYLPEEFTFTTPPPTEVAPQISSANSTAFTVGSAGTFTVSTTGTPTAALSESGALPDGVTFADNGNGTAILSGTPDAGTGGTYDFTVIAANGVSPNASQMFTLTVDQAPAITSANNATFTSGTAGTLMIATTGFPIATLSESGGLPSGVTFTDNHNGTATLSGTPATGTTGQFELTLSAGNGVAPAFSQIFTLTVDSTGNGNGSAATMLAVDTQPVSTTAGTIISVLVVVEDQSGNVVSSNSEVTLSLKRGPSGATLLGTTTVAVQNGSANFGDLSLDETGVYKLMATDGSLAAAKSVKFTISAAAAANLAFQPIPAAITASTAIQPSFVVDIEDAFGNVVTTSTTKVKLSLNAAPAGAAIGGTIKVAAQNGVATFSDISLTEAGNYAISVAHGVLTPAISGDFTVNPAPAAQLAFIQQPSPAIVGVAITPAITVGVEDSFGNLVTSDDSDVRLVIKPGSGPDGAVLDGTLIVAAQNGMAIFSDISLNEVGSYVLKAKDGNLAKAKSVAFNVVVGS